MSKAMLLLLLAVPATAERVSRAQPGTAACPDRAVRVLAIGGELQANSWCDKQAGVERRKAHEDKKKKEREDYNKLKDDERKHKRELEKQVREWEKKAREDREKKHSCRGIGSGAGCTEENPGKGNGKNKAKKKN